MRIKGRPPRVVVLPQHESNSIDYPRHRFRPLTACSNFRYVLLRAGTPHVHIYTRDSSQDMLGFEQKLWWFDLRAHSLAAAFVSNLANHDIDTISLVFLLEQFTSSRRIYLKYFLSWSISDADQPHDSSKSNKLYWHNERIQQAINSSHACWRFETFSYRRCLIELVNWMQLNRLL